MANLKSTMFREYDLRGLVSHDELNEDSIAIIAKAYGTMLRNRGIDDAVVGHDLRTGSKELTQVAVDALRSTGVKVIFLGQILTPIMYSAQYYYKTSGGLMVTASHNPNGWLGFKMALGLSYTFGPDEMRELYQLTVSEDFATGHGEILIEDYIPIYTNDVVKRVEIDKPIRVLINAGNGTAGPIVPPILNIAGCETFEYLTEPDLAFKHYFPNPSLEEMMQDTGRKTVEYGADIGIAIDGDGDRLGVTDEKGHIVWPDQYLILLSRKALEVNPGSPIVFDSKCSRALGEDILAHGGQPVMWKTGHSYIKQKLHELDAPLAGEGSGHIFFGEPIYYGFDDAVFTSLKLVELLSKRNLSFSQMIAQTPSYVATPTLQAPCPDERKYDVITSLVNSLILKGLDVKTFEDPKFGGRVEFATGWGLVRASSNLPVLVLRFEAETQEEVTRIERFFRDELSKYPEVGEKWESG